MKKYKIIYWISTGLLSLMMTFSAYSYFANPEVADGFSHLGFPGYFRVELGLAKLLGALVLIVPQVPAAVKEWAYAGFAITFVSAAVAHISSGDPATYVIGPLVFLAVLFVSKAYSARLSQPVA